MDANLWDVKEPHGTLNNKKPDALRHRVECHMI